MRPSATAVSRLLNVDIMDVNATYMHGSTVLMYAALKGHIAVINGLLAAEGKRTLGIAVAIVP